MISSGNQPFFRFRIEPFKRSSKKNERNALYGDLKLPRLDAQKAPIRFWIRGSGYICQDPPQLVPDPDLRVLN
jgi:hypothetical protein